MLTKVGKFDIIYKHSSREQKQNTEKHSVQAVFENQRVLISKVSNLSDVSKKLTKKFKKPLDKPKTT